MPTVIILPWANIVMPSAFRLYQPPKPFVLSCLLFALCLIVFSPRAQAQVAQRQGQAKVDTRYAIVIHGGAGGDPDNWTEAFRQTRLKGLGHALDHGVSMLENGEPALDVVEQVVRLMEDNEVFNAGRGCVLNELGKHELDASIMDGRDLSCGAVAGVTTTKNPVSLARKVMQETRHVLLSSQGADLFSQAMGVEQAGPEYFRTEAQFESWQRWKKREEEKTSALMPAENPAQQQSYFGTVGCVVLDQHGDLAAATSTGGLLGKRWGRVGDTPILGAGNYADNQTCAVSGTGIGEEFIRHAIGSDIAARMRYGGATLQNAAEGAIASLPENCGGVICVDAQANVAMEFNTRGMSRAFATSKGERGIQLGRE